MFKRIFLTDSIGADIFTKYIPMCRQETYFEGKTIPKIKFVEIDGKTYLEVSSNNNSMAVFKINSELVYTFFMGVLAVLENVD